jgi:hypothetical protein
MEDEPLAGDLLDAAVVVALRRALSKRPDALVSP